MSQVTLLSMDKDEAVVAEKVTTYRREVIEQEIPKLRETIAKEEALIVQLGDHIELAKSRYKDASYELELYTALKEAFDREYPREAEEAQEDKIDEAEETEEEPIPATEEELEEVRKTLSGDTDSLLEPQLATTIEDEN